MAVKMACFIICTVYILDRFLNFIDLAKLLLKRTVTGNSNSWLVTSYCNYWFDLRVLWLWTEMEMQMIGYCTVCSVI